MGLLNTITEHKLRAFLTIRTAGSKLFDGGGLYLTITPARSAIWRIKYRLGTEKTYTIGAYPDVGLEAARAERATVRDAVRVGRDPVLARRIQRAQAIAGHCLSLVCC